MILNLDQLDVSQKSLWKVFSERLETLGFNLKVYSARRGAAVFNIESGIEVGKVTRDMIEDEEMDYILFSRLGLTK